jgi:hypothetical protein
MSDKKFAPAAAARGMEALRRSAPLEQSFHELLNLLHERGIRVLLHYQPRHPAYGAWVEAHALARDNQQSYLRFVRGLADSGVRVQVWENSEEVGLSADDYLDYGHLGRPGAETYTRAITQLIKDEHLLSGQATTQATSESGAGRDPARP